MKTMNQGFLNSSVRTEGHRPTGVQTTSIGNLSLCGTIRLVEPSREMFYLQLPQHEQERIIHWQTQTRFLCRGKEAKPDALHRVQKISVQFASDAAEKVATAIDIVVEPSVAESTEAPRRAVWSRRPLNWSSK